MPPPGPDFIAKAEALVGLDDPKESLQECLQRLYSLALYVDWFTLDVRVKRTRKTVRLIPGHIWSSDRANGPREQSDVMIIGKMAGIEEVKAGRYFYGPSGEILKTALLERVGCPEEIAAGAYVTNIMKFGHPAPQTGNAISKEWIKDCRPLLQMELYLVKPKYILCLGSEAGKELFGQAGSIKNATGKVFDFPVRLPDGTEYVAKAIVCIHPAAVAREPDLQPQLDSSLRLFTRLVQGESVGNVETDLEHIVVQTEEEALKVIGRMMDETASGTHAIAIDCEWEGEQPTELGSWLRTIQISHKPKFACCIVLREKGGAPNLVNSSAVKSALITLFNSTKDRHIRPVGHAYRADLPWLIHYGLDLTRAFEAPADPVTGWLETKTHGGFDTLTAAHAVSEADDYKLEVQATRLVGVHRYDIELQEAKKELCKTKDITAAQLTGYGDIPSHVLYPYACLQRRSLVQLGDGSWQQIGRLVHSRYSGTVKAVIDNYIVNARVVNWHRSYANQKEWVKLRTRSTRNTHTNELSGPIFTPDHEVITQRGRVRVDKLRLGVDAILTDELEFSSDQLSVFLGSILGDGGYVAKKNKSIGFYFSQVGPRKPYADWKALVFGNYNSHLMKTKGDTRRYIIPCSRYIRWLYDKYPIHPFEEHGRRKAIITEQLLSDMGDLGLAVWYQDDGTLAKDNRCNHRRSSIACRQLSNVESDIAVAWLRAKFGTSNIWYAYDYGIIISREAFHSFHDAIRPYMHPSVGYKSIHDITEEYKPEYGKTLFYETVEEIIPWTREYKGSGERYCITVEKAQNFLTHVGFVSNCYDVDATRRLFTVYNGTEQTPGLLDCDEYGSNSRQAFWTSSRAAPACLEMELTGLLVDTKRAKALLDCYLKIQTDKLVELTNLIHWPGFNINSPFDIRELLYGPKYRGQENRGSPDDAILCNIAPVKCTNKKVRKTWSDIEHAGESEMYLPSTDRETLGILFHQVEDDTKTKIISLLRDIKYISQLLKTVLRPSKNEEYTTDGDVVYEAGLLSYVCSDKRIRTHIFQTLETGRYAAARPNLMNISSRRESDFKRVAGDKYLYPIRSIFTAPPGYILSEFDYVGAELAGAAWLSGDPVMIEHMRRAQLPEDHPDFYDIHSNIAVATFKLNCAPTKKGLASIGMAHLRVAAKNVVFGIMYSRGAAAIARQCREEGVNITQADAQAIINGLNAQYRLLQPYFRSCHDAIYDPGIVFNCFGRARRFRPTNDRQVAAELERQSSNYQEQSMVADALSRALDNLYNWPNRKFKIVMSIHDAILLEVPIDGVEYVCDTVVPECMTKRVPIFPTRLDGTRIAERGPYYLGVDSKIMQYWGVSLKKQDCKDLGIPERFGK